MTIDPAEKREKQLARDLTVDVYNCVAKTDEKKRTAETAVRQALEAYRKELLTPEYILAEAEKLLRGKSVTHVSFMYYDYGASDTTNVYTKKKIGHGTLASGFKALG